VTNVLAWMSEHPHFADPVLPNVTLRSVRCSKHEPFRPVIDPGLSAEVMWMSSNVMFRTSGIPDGLLGAFPEYVSPSSNALNSPFGYIHGVGPTGPTRIRRTVMFSIGPGNHLQGIENRGIHAYVMSR
jgi:hypothetical protein